MTIHVQCVLLGRKHHFHSTLSQECYRRKQEQPLSQGRGCSSSCREIDLLQRQLILQIDFNEPTPHKWFLKKKSMELNLCNKISSGRKLMKADEIFSAGILPQVLNLIEKIEEINVAKKSKTTCKKGRLTIGRFYNLRTSLRSPNRNTTRMAWHEFWILMSTGCKSALWHISLVIVIAPIFCLY